MALDNSLLRDVKYGVRSLIRDKGFTATVLVTLAVCIAANTATFAVVHSVLLKPLPVPEARRILIMSNLYPKAGAGPGFYSGVADYYDRIRDVSAFDAQALFQQSSRTIEIEGSPQRIAGMAATPTLLPLLGVTPAVGRNFTAEEGEIGGEKKVILSDGFARQLYGSSTGALGHELRMSGQPYTVVGVMPRDFTFVYPHVRMWVPLAFTAKEKEQRHSNNYQHIGRLKPGATIQQAQAQVDALNAANMDRFPQWREILANAGFHTRVDRLEEMLIGDVRASLYMLWGGAAFVLLIGALNVANLVLARTALRRKELATRLALGAGPVRLIRQLVVENVMLAAASAFAGVALGAGILALLSHNGFENLPRAGEVRIDGVVMLVAFALSVAIGVAIGVIPAWQVFRTELASMMREESRTGTGRRAKRVRQTLVVAEVGLAFVLLAGSGLLLASFRQLLHVNPGYTTVNVITAASSAPKAVYPDDASLRALMDRSLEALRRIPGVEAAGATDLLPLGGDSSDSVILAEGYQMQPGESLVSPMQSSITPGYFEAMKISMVKGRAFDQRDSATTLPVIIVDERLAKHFWPNSDPIGKRMFQPQDINNLFKADEHTVFRTVVGVVHDVRQKDLQDKGAEVGMYYNPFAQSTSHGFVFTVRGSGDTTTIARSVREEYSKVAPTLALFDMHSMAERVDLTLASRKTSLSLALGFALVALFLSAIGIYGVLAYLVTQRQREIGIRAALGCTEAGIVKLVMGEGLLLLGVGLALGIVGATGLRRAIETQIFGVRPFDPVVMSGVVLSLVVVALVACVVPARRAVGVDPAIVLRDQ